MEFSLEAAELMLCSSSVFRPMLRLQSVTKKEQLVVGGVERVLRVCNACKYRVSEH